MTRSISPPRPRPPAGGSAAAAARPASRRATTGPARTGRRPARAGRRCRGGPAPRPPAPPAAPRSTRASSCGSEWTFSSGTGEELDQVADGRLPEDLGRAVVVGAGDPLGQVPDQPGELVEERLLGKPAPPRRTGPRPAPAPARRPAARGPPGSPAARPSGNHSSPSASTSCSGGDRADSLGGDVVWEVETRKPFHNRLGAGTPRLSTPSSPWSLSY